MSPFAAYQMYTAVKLHFNSDSYDFFKYHGKVRVDETRFETRKDKYHYYKLTKRADPLLLTVVNVFHDSNVWIGNLFSVECEKRYRDRKAVMQSIEYTVESELSQYDSFDEALNVKNGDYPSLLKQYKDGEVSLETLIIVNRINNGKVFDYWSDSISDPVVWPDLKNRLLKYEPFLGDDILKRDKWLTLM